MLDIQYYECQVTETDLSPARLDGRSVETFKSPATMPKVQKLYVVMAGGQFCYVGITSQPVAARLRLGFNPKAGTGYYGYAWRHLKDVDLYVWVTRDLGRDDIEAVEAELVYAIRHGTGNWPLHQTEIHFRNPPGETAAKVRKIAQDLFEQLRQSKWKGGHEEPN